MVRYVALRYIKVAYGLRLAMSILRLGVGF